jgi:hypothetical protein
VSISYLHSPENGHLHNYINYLKSQADYEDNICIDYANWLGVPKELQFDINKELEIDGESIKIIAK